MPYNIGDTLLDKYRIEEQIGSGAFGEVYRITHLKLNAPRALKVLRKDAPGLGSTEYGEYQDRFKLEAQLGAKLNHPNLIQVHDFEMDGDDLLLVMEYAAGGNLSKRIEQSKRGGNPVPLETALAIAQEVAEGLTKLHELDVVHRDLKPSNILFDEKGHAKVADFGLAQTPGGPSMRSQLSNPPPHPGTPAYMSPEQKNTKDYLTSASDVYALGLVLFEMLTGRVYRSQRPGTRAVGLREDIPAWLDDLLTAMLSETPENRPWDGKEVLTKLYAGGRVEEEKQEGKISKKIPLRQEKRDATKKVARKTKENKTHKPENDTIKRGWNSNIVIISGMVIILFGLIIGLSQFDGPSSAPTATATMTKTKTPTVTFTISPPSKTPRPTSTQSITSTFTLSPTLTQVGISSPTQKFTYCSWGFEWNASSYQRNECGCAGDSCSCITYYYNTKGEFLKDTQSYHWYDNYSISKNVAEGEAREYNGTCK